MEKNFLMKFYSIYDSHSQIKHYPELFFRGFVSFDKQGVLFNEYLSSNTYINLIPISKYKKFLSINKIFIKLAFKSQKEANLLIDLIGVRLNGEHVYVNSILFNLNPDVKNIIEIPLNLDDLSTDIAYVYWNIKVLNSSDNQNFYIHFLNADSGVLTDREPHREIRLAIITPTYKRETYILNNIEKLKNHGILEKLDIRLIVVDNGRTLKSFLSEEFIGERKIKIIENINAGGAGGFARGLIEVFENFPDRTHCIFMDDDIDLEPFTLERLYDFLKYSSVPNLGIGGSMLSYKFPYVMWESGAFYRIYRINTLFLNKFNTNLLEENNLPKLLEDPAWTYWGWWFLCLPTDVFKKCGLPLPIFFRGDDMEYGFRLVKENIEVTDLSGIFVLHEDFFAKHNAFTNYLITRNEMILRALHGELNAFNEAKFLLKTVLRFLFSYRYETAEMTLRGCEDFLKGPDLLLKIDPEQFYGDLNKEVTNEKTKVIDSKYIKEFLKFNQNSGKIKTLAKKWLHFITLGSHILPPFKTDNKKNNVFKEDYLIDDLHSYNFPAFFMKTKILYYNDLYRVGYFVHKNSLRFFMTVSKSIYIIFKLLIKYKKVKNSYLENYKDLISENNWKKYLKINKMDLNK